MVKIQTYEAKDMTIKENFVIDNGTWNATKISPQFGGTGADFSFQGGMHTGLVTFANATATLVAPSSGPIDAVFDEDDMSSNSAVGLVTQQSVKAFVEAQASPGIFLFMVSTSTFWVNNLHSPIKDPICLSFCPVHG